VYERTYLVCLIGYIPLQAIPLYLVDYCVHNDHNMTMWLLIVLTYDITTFPH